MKTFSSLFCVFAFLLFPVLLAAQSAQVSGKVTNGETAAEFINVILFKASDTSLVMLQLADEEGLFRFDALEAGQYFIKTSGIGFNEQFHPVFQLAEGQQFQHALINAENNALQLGLVEVVARKPFLEQQAGKLVVNVSDNITGQTGSVVDLLKKVPGLIVVGDRISMAGKSGLTILLDGRPTKYMDIQSLLREMPADNIKSIEVISQPGAALDAEGSGGVINIILKKNTLLGTNGTAYVGGGYGTLAKYRTGVQLNRRKGALNLSAGLSYNHGSWTEGLEVDRLVSNQFFSQKSFEEAWSDSYSAHFGADYDLNEHHRIGFNSRAYRSNTRMEGDNITNIFSSQQGDLLSSFGTRNERDRLTNSFSTDAFYRWKIDTLGQELTLDGSYSRFKRANQNDLLTNGDISQLRRNEEPALVQLYTTQIDYKRPLNPQLRVESGLKYSFAALDNELLASIKDNENWRNDPLLSNHYLYDEAIFAAYTQMHYQTEKLEINFGLRYENTNTLGNNLTIDSINRLDYGKLFPSLSLSMPLNEKLGVAAAYSYRIERPSYYNLNPFVNFIDPFTFQKGNPFLRPELIHSGSLSLTFDKQPFFNLSYDHTSDVISNVTQQDDESSILFQTAVNLDNFRRYGGQLFFPLDWIAKPVSGFAGVMAYYQSYNAQYLGAELRNNQMNWTAFSQFNIQLPQEWKMEITGWFQGQSIEEGLIRGEYLYGVDAGLQKKMLDGRLNLQLSVDNLFFRYFHGRINYENQQINILSTWEAPRFQCRLTYSFGNRFLKKKDSINTSGSDLRKRVDMQ